VTRTRIMAQAFGRLSSIGVWDVAKSDRQPLFELRHDFTVLVFTGNEDWLVTGDANGDIKLWRAVDGAHVRTWTQHTGLIKALDLHPTHGICSLDREGAVKIFNPANPSPSQEASFDGASTMQWNASGAEFILGFAGKDGRIVAVDRATMRPTLNLPAYSGRPLWVDDRKIVFRYFADPGSRLVIYDRRTKKQHALPGDGFVACAGWSFLYEPAHCQRIRVTSFQSPTNKDNEVDEKNSAHVKRQKC
jgi:WD40 repeat protein